MLLLTAASIASDLDDAIARLLKRGSGGRRSETEAPLPVDMAASDAAERLRLWLLRMTVEFVTSVDEWPPSDIRTMARYLLVRIADIRVHYTAAGDLNGLRERVHQALAVIDRKPERAPAGQCDNCGRQLLAELGAESVTCACGMTALALQDKRRERAAAADVLGTAAEISGALERIGIRIPRGTITSWASRGRLLPRPGGAYALSDVLALHAQSQTRR